MMNSYAERHYDVALPLWSRCFASLLYLLLLAGLFGMQTILSVMDDPVR